MRSFDSADVILYENEEFIVGLDSDDENYPLVIGVKLEGGRVEEEWLTADDAQELVNALAKAFPPVGVALPPKGPTHIQEGGLHTIIVHLHGRAGGT